MDRRDLFERLVREYGDKAYNFAFRLAGNAPDASDLVQEAFARALEHFDRYDAEKPFQNWLYQILHHIFLDLVKRAEHKRSVSLDKTIGDEDTAWHDVLPATESSPMDVLVNQERDMLIQDTLATLPLPYRTAVTLCDIEGLSYQAISEIMACPVGTVRSRIHEGRRLMRLAYDKRQGRFHE